MPKTKPDSKPVDDDSDDDDAPPPPPESIEMVEFDFYGETFVVPKDRDEWDTEAFIAISEVRVPLDNLKVMRLIIGDAQYAKLRQIGKSRRVSREFSELLGEVTSEQCIN
jgi:hypothetical protein